MKITYWLLAAVSLLLLVIGFSVFAPSESGNVSAEQLDQWYLQSVIIAALVGAVVGLACGYLVPRFVQARRGEATEQFHGRVIRWGLLGAAASAVLTLLVTLQLAYGNASWPVAPGERLSLVLGSGKYFAVVAAAWLLSSLVYSLLVTVRAWHGRGALLRP